MSDTLRVMFYDKSEWAGDKLVSSWFAGGLLYKAVRRLDVCVGVESWEEALDWLATYEPKKKISMLQFWGHGSPGAVWINGEPLRNNALKVNHPYNERLLQLKDRLADDATIWFRCCSIFAGGTGHKFASKWSTFFDCRIAAHTFIIGPFQSGLYTITPGQKPYWPLEEGIGEDGEMLWSHFWKPKTIFCLKATIPKDW
jgi:hypothetical protein